MRYAITWTPDAEQDLAAVWLAAPHKSAVTAASNEIERRLGTDPLTFGESRGSSVSRVAAVPPLVVWFEVVEDDRRVVVHAAARSG